MTPAAVYTDGACIGSGGNCPGGYAALILTDTGERTVTGRNLATTSTAMELMGVICGLDALPPGLSAAVHTDSRYVITGITERLPWWRSRGWRVMNGRKVANRDLWQRLSGLVSERQVAWHWLKAHAGHPLNERVHALAYEQAQRACRDRGTSSGRTEILRP